MAAVCWLRISILLNGMMMAIKASDIICNSEYDECIIDCLGPTSCSYIDYNINISNKSQSSPIYKFYCHGTYSCNYLNIFSAQNISILCYGDHSCHSLSIYESTNNQNIDNNKNIIINTFDTCLPFDIGIICDDKSSKCDILCASKYINIYSKSFVFITETNKCIDKVFSNSCNENKEYYWCQEKLDDGIINVATWNITKKDINSSSDCDATSTYYIQTETSRYKYICSSYNDKCIIDCSIRICNNVIIDATNAKYFSLTCGKTKTEQCSFMDIYLGPTTKSDISINQHLDLLNQNVTIHKTGRNIAKLYSIENQFTVSWSDLIYNKSIKNASIVLAFFNVFILVLFPMIYLLILWMNNIRDEMNNKYISSKPSKLVLYYIAFCDMCVIITMYWWFIKMCDLFRIWAQQYCQNNVALDEWIPYLEACDANQWCQSKKYYCGRDVNNSMYAFFVSWIMFFVLVMVTEIFRPCPPRKHFYKFFGDCYFLCDCCHSEETQLLYNRRALWDFKLFRDCDWDYRPGYIYCCYCSRCCYCYSTPTWTSPLILCDYFVRYGIQFIFGTIYYGLLLYDDIGDYALTWYDYWTVWIIFFVKITVQHIFSCMEPFDEEQDKKNEKIFYDKQNKELKEREMML